MARASNRLTVLKVKQLTDPGRYNDGDGLYLFVAMNTLKTLIKPINTGF